MLDLPQLSGNILPEGANAPDAVFDPDLIQMAFWQFDEKFERFTLPQCQDLVNAANVRILLNATAMTLDSSDNGRQITEVTVGSLTGRRTRVRARCFILATGGLEVPRLLLNSKTQAHPDGISNQHDRVGRYFMEHPHARGGRIITDDPARLFKSLPRFRRHQGLRYGMLLRPGEALQAREALLNSCFTLGVRLNEGEQQQFYKNIYNNLRHDLSPTAFGRAMWKLTKKASTLVQDRFGAALNLRKLKQPGSGIHAVIRAEQAPNPDSRVTVNPEARDALGLPRLTLDWQFSAIDKHSVTGMMAGSNPPTGWPTVTGSGNSIL
ncbi:MAG: hypothetical protein RQ715_02045 [Methylococcales bacterium]|nr:hypothetical protein [Methylococcales bacterium]